MICEAYFNKNVKNPFNCPENRAEGYQLERLIPLCLWLRQTLGDSQEYVEIYSSS